MTSLGSAWRSFWHTMTSADRHASHNSPFRTGQHVPLSQNRQEPLTSVATNANESRTDLSGEDGHPPLPRRASAPTTPGTPYSPGMRSAMQRTDSHENTVDAKTGVSTGEIQMQAFSDGLPPPPPVSHSWKRIDRWAEEHYEELADNLCEGCTQNDINELEHELDCTLPMEVRESLQVHDGQDGGGRPTGIVFGSMLLDCEEIVHEWRNWRTVSDEVLAQPPPVQVQTSTEAPPLKAFDGATSSSSAPPPSAPLPVPAQPRNPHWREDLLKRQDSQPSNAIQKTYAHPAWIPLARDWGGNNLAVDLSPAPAGKWGQVILMGRDYDCKYVVSRSWAAFLATLADDLNSSKWFVNDETGELKLREFRQQNVEPSYFDILRWRADQKHGRRVLRKQRPVLTNGDRRASAGSGPPPATRGSPYASPTIPGSPKHPRDPDRDRFPRGRSPPRKNSKGLPLASPTGGNLARVAEESGRNHVEPLISTDTPISPLAPAHLSGKENVHVASNAAGLGMHNVDLHDPKSP